MSFPELDLIYPKLIERLDSARYYHSLGVMQVSVALALAHGVNPGRAALAGLLHDCERCETVEGLRAKIDRFKIEIPPEEMAHPSLLHTYVGPHTARLDFGVTDAAVLQAMRRHSTADAEMTTLDKIMYVADLIDPSRGLPNENLKIIRSLAFQELDAAFRLAIEEKVAYCRERKLRMSPRSVRAIERYLN